jgi:nucleotide-binding universal stress UspA family protein
MRTATRRGPPRRTPLEPPGPAKVAGLPLTRILAPLDFSEAAEAALQFALPFARASGAQLDLLHVIPPVVWLADAWYPAAELSALRQVNRFENRQQAAALARLQQRADALQDPTRIRALVRRGEPARTIVDVARQLRSDWVVLSTCGRSGLTRFFLGSTAEAVVRRAPCPVLTVRQPARARRDTPQAPPSTKLRRMLVPVDFASGAGHLLQYAAAFAREFRAALLLLHVIQPVRVPTRLALETTRLHREARQRGQRRLEALAAQYLPAGLPARQVVRVGVPYGVINTLARRASVDLIILGTRGQHGLRRWVLGSTAERVVRHAPCPVLVVR